MDISAIGLGLTIDLAAIFVLAYGIFFRRHGKADVALAYTALNVGVFAAVVLLSGSEVNMGFAFGLFGILSIIRLRSTTLSQNEVAYFFVSLVLGLINSLGATEPVLVIGFDILLLTLMIAFDRQFSTRSVSEQRVVLDRALTDPKILREEVEFRLNSPVVAVEILEIDFVREMTIVNASVRQASRIDSSARSLSFSRS